ELSPQGIEAGGWGFNLTTEEIASFAQCLLEGGRRDGKQIIPADYFRQATSVQADNSMNDQPDWKTGYGFQFWRC
ncbi:MAG TPA: serine hydrolase, partial [Lentisphaeria bacterium]|nr:serine hydrolase [Lentisphaeria bacterium]